MNISSLCQFAVILQTSSSAVESPARKALENNAESDFFWLLISTGFVALGILLEFPEVKHDFVEWWRSRKKPWVIDPSPTNRSTVPLWSLVGFLIVTAGVAGEGIYEGLLGINDTKIRKIDETSLAADELQIAQQKTRAANAESNIALAEQHSAEANAKAEGFRLDIAKANKSAKDAEARAAEANLELARYKAPRHLSSAQQADIGKYLRKFDPTHFDRLIVGDSLEIGRIAGEILESVQAGGWLMGNNGHAMGLSAAGVVVSTRFGSTPQIEQTADALVTALKAQGIVAVKGAQFGDELPGAGIAGAWNLNNAPIRIIVGAKP